jgi:hypothetical protein
MVKQTKPTDDEFVRMYYEHQHERVAKLEESRLTITNYVLALSALVFTFGYQNVADLSPINGITLPLIIIIANYFPMRYIDRSTDFIRVHKDRARTILKKYAPELGALNEDITWPKSSGFLGSRKRLQKAIHGIVMLTALIPMALFLYQLWSPSIP